MIQKVVETKLEDLQEGDQIICPFCKKEVSLAKDSQGELSAVGNHDKDCAIDGQPLIETYINLRFKKVCA